MLKTLGTYGSKMGRTHVRQASVVVLHTYSQRCVDNVANPILSLADNKSQFPFDEPL